MNNNLRFAGVPLLLSIMLAGCGGGGGGGAAAVPVTGASSGFTSWGAVAANTSVTVQGSSQQASYTWNSGTNQITSLTGASNFAPTATAIATFNASNLLSALTFTSAGGTSFSLSAANGDTFGVLIANSAVGAAVSKDGATYALFANPSSFGWSYQTFGTWATGAGTGSGTVGSFSIGSLTPGSAIPTSGTATYTGATGGRYVDSTAASYFTSANMTASVDFGARTVALNTTGTQVSTNLQSFAAANSLNLSGTLSYAAGTNQFSGTVATVGGAASNAAMTGTAKGNFYGPAAQEIGGGFTVTGSGSTAYMGSFGGKK